MPSTTLLAPVNESLKVLIQNERTQWFTDQTLRRAFVQGIVRNGCSPSLLLLKTLDTSYFLVESTCRENSDHEERPKYVYQGGKFFQVLGDA